MCLADRTVRALWRDIPKLDASCPWIDRGVRRVHFADATMSRDRFYLLALVWLLRVVGSLLFVTFSGGS